MSAPQEHAVVRAARVAHCAPCSRSIEYAEGETFRSWRVRLRAFLRRHPDPRVSVERSVAPEIEWLKRRST